MARNGSLKSRNKQPVNGVICENGNKNNYFKFKKDESNNSYTNGHANGISYGISNGSSNKIYYKRKWSESFEPIPYLTAILTCFGFYLLMIMGYINYLLFVPNIAKEKNRDGYPDLYDKFVLFYSRYVYRRIVDCFNRPITSVPGPMITIKDRETPDFGWTFNDIKKFVSLLKEEKLQFYCENQNLHEEIHELRTTLDNLLVENDKFKVFIKRKDETIDKLKNNINELEENCAKKDEENVETAQVFDVCAEQKAAIQQLKQDLDNCNKQISKLEEKNENLRRFCQEKDIVNRRLSNKMNELEEQIANHENEMKCMEDENEKIKQQLDDCQDEIEVIIRERDDAMNKINKLENIKIKDQETISELETIIEQAKENLENEIEHGKRVEEERNQCVSENRKIKMKNTFLEEELESVKCNAADMSKTINKLQRDLEVITLEYQEYKDKMKDENSKLKNQICKLQEQLQAQRKQLDVSNRNLNQTQNQLKKINREYAEFKKHIDELKEQLKNKTNGNLNCEGNEMNYNDFEQDFENKETKFNCDKRKHKKNRYVDFEDAPSEKSGREAYKNFSRDKPPRSINFDIKCSQKSKKNKPMKEKKCSKSYGKRNVKEKSKKSPTRSSYSSDCGSLCPSSIGDGGKSKSLCLSKKGNDNGKSKSLCLPKSSNKYENCMSKSKFKNSTRHSCK